jgi:hypothetical protein
VTVDTVSFDEEQTKLEAGSFDMALASFQMDVAPDAGFMLMKGNRQLLPLRIQRNDQPFQHVRTCYNRDDFAYAMQAIQQQFANDAPFVCLFNRASDSERARCTPPCATSASLNCCAASSVRR